MGRAYPQRSCRASPSLFTWWINPACLLGCGRIGIHTAEAAKGLGMHVIAYNRSQSQAAKDLGVEFVDLDGLFARSDVLALQMPLADFNVGIINKENIAKMKDGVIILNNSRGQMVVEQDLTDALNSGKVEIGRAHV